jgi:hypothetical protein
VAFHYYAQCESAPNSDRGCYLTLPAALTSLFTQVCAGTDITVSARTAAPDGSQLVESNPINLAWSETELTGGLYYWTTLPAPMNHGLTGIARYDLHGDSSTPQVIYTDNGSAPDHVYGNTCIGCHALTHDGRRMALTIGGSTPSDWMLLDLTQLKQPLALKNLAPGFATETTFSPDDTRMVNMYRGDFELRGADASLIDQGPILTTAVSEKKTDAFWSSDGTLFAFVSWQPGQNGALSATDPFGLNGDMKTGGQIWIAPSDGQTVMDQPTLLVPRATGFTSYYPAISDDSTLVVFNQSSCSGPGTSLGYGDGPCDGYADPSARLFLILPSGGAPVVLDRANGPANSMNSWPRFSPDHGQFRGKQLYWIAYSSERPYGLQLNQQNGPPQRPQLWFTAVTVTKGMPISKDPSFPPAWLPGQNSVPSTTSGNHVPQWVSVAVPIS